MDILIAKYEVIGIVDYMAIYAYVNLRVHIPV